MLRDEDRIFTNIYGFHGADLVAAKSRGDWDNTAAIIKKGRDWVIDEVKNSGTTATAQAGIFHLVNYPVTAFFDKVGCIVPVAPRLCCYQIGTVKSVNIGKDTIFVA